ncbi:MAG: hypothetical protein AB7F35_00645 [Acetobacteraceae bacterium]
MRDQVRKEEAYRGNYKSFTDVAKLYEDGKHRRYGLLFSVNGGTLGLAKLFAEDKAGDFLGSLTIPQLAYGMIVFTLLMWWDLWTFGQRLREDVGDHERGSRNKGMFSLTGKTVLSVICLMIIGAWWQVTR